MLAPKKLTFEVVTPLYLGGVEPRQRAGPQGEDSPDRVQRDTRIRLRPILSMWRMWHRALMGAKVGTDNAGLKEIADSERRLFGGGGGNATAGAFRARLVEESNVDLRTFTERNLQTGGTAEPAHCCYSTYLGYGMASRREGGQLTEYPRWAIAPGAKFAVEVLAEDSTWPDLEMAIDTWVHCGGLGARHRRGLGSIRWADRPAERGDFFGGVLTKHVGGGASFSDEPAFEVLHPDWCRIAVVPMCFGSYVEALTAIKNQLRIDAGKFVPKNGRFDQPDEINCANAARSRPVRLPDPVTVPHFHLSGTGYGWRQRWDDKKNPWRLQKKTIAGRDFAFYWGRDHDQAQIVKGGRATGRTIQLQNVSFGLPEAYSTWKVMIEAVLGDKEIRRPSPISFRVYKLEDQKYQVAVLLFKSRFLPRGAAIKAKLHGREQCDVAPPTVWRYLDNFFDACNGTVVFGR